MKYFPTFATAVSLLVLSSCDKAKETAQASADKAQTAAANAADKGKVIAEQAGDKAKTMVAEAKDKLATVAKDAVGQIPDAAKTAFVAALEGLKKMIADLKTSSANGPPSVEKMDAIQAAMVALPTTGLPADLKSAVDAVTAKSAEEMAAVKPLMANPAAITPELQATLQKLSTESKDLGEKAIEVAAKYGIDISFMR